MAEVNQLRIGNIFFDHFHQLERELQLSDFERSVKGPSFFEYLQPIPINESWVRSFGFIIQKTSGGVSFFDLTIIDGPLCMVFSGDHLILSYRRKDDMLIDLQTRIYFVHQLQNLYSATAFNELLMPIWK